jgi:hypothetical protein
MTSSIPNDMLSPTRCLGLPVWEKGLLEGCSKIVRQSQDRKKLFTTKRLFTPEQSYQRLPRMLSPFDNPVPSALLISCVAAPESKYIGLLFGPAPDQPGNPAS